MSLPLQPLSRQQVRAIDQRAIRDYGIPGMVLMENAGRGCAEVILRVAPPGPVAILCGKGNNAGDGYTIARHLQIAASSASKGLLAERSVRIIQLYDPEELSGDAAANWAIIEKAEIPHRVITAPDEEALGEALDECTMIVDAMLGTGASGNPRPPIATAIRVANELPAMRIAIDIPSGLDCDSGDPGDPCFRADHTCTMVAAKCGFANPAAKPYTGTIHTIGIGIPLHLLRTLERSEL